MDKIRDPKELNRMSAQESEKAQQMAAYLDAHIEACKPSWGMLASVLQPNIDDPGALLAESMPGESTRRLWLRADGELLESGQTPEGQRFTRLLSCEEASRRYDAVAIVELLYSTVESSLKRSQEIVQRIEAKAKDGGPSLG